MPVLHHRFGFSHVWKNGNKHSLKVSRHLTIYLFYFVFCAHQHYWTVDVDLLTPLLCHARSDFQQQLQLGQCFQTSLYKPCWFALFLVI